MFFFILVDFFSGYVKMDVTSRFLALFFALDKFIISSVRPIFINNQLVFDELVNDLVDQLLTFERYFWRTAVCVSFF